MSFVIVFDIPSIERTERRRINRELNRMGAKQLQDSFWKFDQLKPLIQLGSKIRKLGGQAQILEERFLF